MAKTNININVCKTSRIGKVFIKLTFLGVMKSTNLFFPFPLGDLWWEACPLYFLICSLTNLSYKKAAPLNCGRTSHATNTNFTSYHIGILQTYTYTYIYIHTHTHISAQNKCEKEYYLEKYYEIESFSYYHSRAGWSTISTRVRNEYKIQ